LPKLTAACVALLVVGAILRLVGPRIVGWASGRRVQLILGLVVTAGAALLLAVGYERPRLFGIAYETIGGVRQRTWDEINVSRLSWFITLPGLALMLLGLAIVAMRRWSASLWLLTVPLIAFMPVYMLRSRVAPRLMWWGRRYVPSVLPLIIILIALVLGVALTAIVAKAKGWRGALGGNRVWVLRLGSVACVVALLAFYINESWPLRKHNEFGGSFAVTSRIAAAAGGKQGVFLWEETPIPGPPRLFGAALWLERGQISVLLPNDERLDAAYVAKFAKAFPGQPLFIIWNGPAKPTIPGVDLAAVDHVVAPIPVWQENVEHRPTGPQTIAVNFVIYKASAASATS
jgi:hypothetical protein